MDKFIAIGKELKSHTAAKEIQNITRYLQTYTDNELRDKVIELCLLKNVQCQELIELPRDNCRKELMIIIQASI